MNDIAFRVIGLAACIVLIALFGVLFYSTHQRGVCKQTAIEHGYSAGDVIAICNQ